MGIIRSWSTNVGVYNKTEALGYVFAREETQMLIFFWSCSSQLWAIGERFLLVATKRTLVLNHSRDGCAEETAGQLSHSCCLPADLLDEQDECCCAPGSPHQALSCPMYSQSPFPFLPSCTGTEAAFSSLMENHCFASFWSFFQIGYQSWPEWRYLKRVRCLKSRLPLPQARLGRSS